MSKWATPCWKKSHSFNFLYHTHSYKWLQIHGFWEGGKFMKEILFNLYHHRPTKSESLFIFFLILPAIEDSYPLFTGTLVSPVRICFTGNVHIFPFRRKPLKRHKLWNLQNIHKQKKKKRKKLKNYKWNLFQNLDVQLHYMRCFEKFLLS
jgi:hypothetical protein